MSAATLSVRRVLSPTALAKRHELAVSGRGRRSGSDIRWASFDGRRYPDAALELAASTFAGMAYGEYAAVGLFARVAAALATNGAPFDLVSAATRVPDDEIRHADYTLRMATLLAGGEAAIAFDRNGIRQYWGPIETSEELDGTMAELAAVDETLAASLVRGCAERATDPVVSSVFASLLADEVHHARLGWYYLEWRAPQWTRPERQRVADRVGPVIARMETQFGQGRDAPRGAIRASRALGVLDTATQRQIVRRAVEDEIVPALDALGLGASHAWRTRQRIAG